MSKTFWKVFRNVLLVIGIIALLGVYITTVSNLPSRIYTEPQREFLAYNQMRSIQQIAPSLEMKVGDSISMAEGEVIPPLQLPWQKSRVKAKLKARFEEEGGVSVAVYDLEFSGVYELTHTSDVNATVGVFFPFPANLETYHEVSFLVDGEEPDDVTYSTSGISWETYLQPGDSFEVEISYRAEGANSFSYGLMHNQRTDIDISVDVEGLTGAEVAKGSLPESSVEGTDNSEYWAWHYDGLIADRDIRLNLPKQLNFAQRVAAKQSDFRALSQAAPFLVGLFLIVLAMFLRVSNTRLRLESYLLMGLGMVIFFPLLTFMSAALPPVIAAIMSFLIVAGLMVMFIKRAVNDRTVILRTGLLLIVFLGLFALGIISPWRGLFFTLGGLVLVGAFMAMYAQNAVLPEPPAPPAPEPGTEVEPEPDEAAIAEEMTEAEREPGYPTPVVEEVVIPEQKPAHSHCPHCGRTLEEDFGFCPGCGRETSEVQRCEHCGYLQFIPTDSDTRFCVKCGNEVRSRKSEV